MAAEKISRGNLCRYNLLVIGISCLVAFFLFLICGFAIVAVLFILSFVLRPFIPMDFPHWVHIMKMSLMALAGIMGLLTVCAVFKNIKSRKDGQ